MAQDDARGAGKGHSCRASISLVKELGLNPRDNETTLKGCKWGRNMRDWSFRRSRMAMEWWIGSSSGMDGVTALPVSLRPSAELRGKEGKLRAQGSP